MVIPTPKQLILFAPLCLVLLTVLCVESARAQEPCSTEAELSAILAQTNAGGPVQFNKKLHDELLKLEEKDHERMQTALDEGRNEETLKKRMQEGREINTARLCPVLKQFGWPTVGLVGKDGVASAFFLLKNSSSAVLQRGLLPTIIAAVRKDEIDKADFAGYFDHLRLAAGLKQLFGTQAKLEDGFVVLFPIEGEAHVDARRQQYGLPPLADYLRYLEQNYKMPVIKSPSAPEDPNRAGSTAIGTAELFSGGTGDSADVVKVDTSLVSVNVSVYNKQQGTLVGTLEKKDFVVYEDGKEEPVSFFAATDVPFDLVLLLDLSGSTSKKRRLIRQTTQRFIEAARPMDRIAIVTFSDTTNVVSPLTDDRARLLQLASKIEGQGGSKVWDALKFTLDQVVGPKTLDRRRAVVFMTDGVDNALFYWQDQGSVISFADLLETVRRNDATVIPIYLDTEGDEIAPEHVYRNARKTLMALADESGGMYYKAKKVEDLNGVYEQVLNDLGKVYSLGYRPANEKRDGSWRKLRIELPQHPELNPRSRRGYYAN